MRGLGAATVIFLGSLCVVASQHHHEQSDAAEAADDDDEDMYSAPTVNYERIASLVRAPLFYSSPLESSDDYVREASFDARSAADTSGGAVPAGGAIGGFVAPYPSLVLEAPKLGAVDSYGVGAPQPKRPLLGVRPAYVPQAYNPQPQPLNPHSKQLDLPLPPVPAAQLQTPGQQPYSQLFNPNASPYGAIRALNLDAKSESIKPALSRVPTGLYPKKYDSSVHDFGKPKKAAKDVEIEMDEGGDEDERDDINDYDSDEETTTAQPLARKELPKPQKYVVAPTAASQYRESTSQVPKYVSFESSPTRSSYAESDWQSKMEKQRRKFDEAQKKLLAKKKEKSLADAAAAKARGEQLASASGVHSLQDDDGGISSVAHGATGERTDFQMFGQHGPHSYKFGYDTGEGHGRQFRYEERDNDGYVKGHYGFYDKEGKLQIVNYDAHPHHGFHAEIGKES